MDPPGLTRYPASGGGEGGGEGGGGGASSFSPSASLPPPTTTNTTTSSSASTAEHPHLQILSSKEIISHNFQIPSKRINSGSDVQFFHTTKAYRDIVSFIMQLNRSVCPRFNSDNKQVRAFPLVEEEEEEEYEAKYPESVKKLRKLLERVGKIIEEVPAEEYADRRFGNRAFRVWWRRLEGERGLLGGLGLEGVNKKDKADEEDEEVGEVIKVEDGLKREVIKEGEKQGQVVAEKDELGVYFMGSWGSAERLDYGTGHELSFLAFLGGLWKLGYFGESPGEEVQRAIVLGVVEMYLKVVRKLILTYTLEPAGSHGVWGLDDHSFLPYIFGSAQLTRPIHENEPMPLEGSAPGAPKPSEVAKPASVQNRRGENMYFSAIGFIYDVKKGPFWEHSPTLYDISGIQFGWGKINKGMIKMYDAEVLGKFPVVQHFPFGSLFEWEQVPGARLGGQSVHIASQPTTTTNTAAPFGIGSAAPGGTVMPPPTSGQRGGVPTTRMPRPMTTIAPGATGRFEQNRSGDRPAQGGPSDMLPSSFNTGTPGTASNQFAITKAPWAKD